MKGNRFYLIAGDMLAFLLAYAIGGYVFWEIRHSENLFSSFYSWGAVYLTIIPVGVAWFYLYGHYTRRWPFWDEMRGIFRVVIGLTIIEGAFIFLAKSSFSRIWFSTTFFSLLWVIPVLRQLVKQLLMLLGKWQAATVIVGTGENAVEVMNAITSEPMMGFDVKAFAALGNSTASTIKGIKVWSIEEGFEQALSKAGIACVVVALDHDETNGTTELIERLQRFTLDLYVVPALRGIPLYGMEIHHFFRHEVIMLRVRNNLLRPVVRLLKRCFDIFVAGLLLLFLSPLFLVLGMLICRDGGPVFFSHRRVGMNGQFFVCRKFRSMVPNASEVLAQLLDNDPAMRAEWDKDFKLKKDPRITRVGAFLRNSSLDELPQLWNVFKGEMSLVGPRPLVEEELERYGEQVYYYLNARPGMTGLWQVSGRNDTDYCHRVYLDVWYIKNWSLWTDIAILFKTVRVVLSKQGAY